MLPAKFQYRLPDKRGFDCSLCERANSIEWMMQCYQCTRRFHGNCLGLQERPAIDIVWTCPNCEYVYEQFSKQADYKKKLEKLIEEKLDLERQMLNAPNNEILLEAQTQVENLQERIRSLESERTKESEAQATIENLRRQVQSLQQARDQGETGTQNMDLVDPRQSENSLLLKIQNQLEKLQKENLEMKREVLETRNLYADFGGGAVGGAPADVSQTILQAFDRTLKINQDNFQTLIRQNTETIGNIVQTAARQSPGSDLGRARKNLATLPKFNGNPIEFPRFRKIFVNTSKEGAYTISEDRERLEKALGGEAKDAVFGLLGDPSNLKAVMDRLTLLYGKPERVYEEYKREIFKLKKAQGDDSNLVKLHFTLDNFVTSMKCLEEEKYDTDAVLIRLVFNRLSDDLQSKWLKQKAADRQLIPNASRTGTIPNNNTRPPPSGDNLQEEVRDYWVMHNLTDHKLYTVKDLMNFIEPHVMAAMMKTDLKLGSYEKSHKEKDSRSPRVNVHQNKKDKAKGNTSKQVKPFNLTCGHCNASGHQTSDCKKFKELTLDEKWKSVKEKKLCTGCLKSANHNWKDCRYKKVCGFKGCTYQHHTLIHSPTKEASEAKDMDEFSMQVHEKQNNDEDSKKVTLYQILPVTVYHYGQRVDTYAFLDSGSSGTFIEPDLAEELGLKGKNVNFKLAWTNGIKHEVKNSKEVSFGISARDASKRYAVRKAKTLKLNLASQSFQIQDIVNNEHLKNIPIIEFQNAKPKILIGLDHSHLITSIGPVKKGKGPNTIYAAKMLLGYVAYGSHSPRYGYNEKLAQLLLLENNNEDNLGDGDLRIKGGTEVHLQVHQGEFSNEKNSLKNSTGNKQKTSLKKDNALIQVNQVNSNEDLGKEESKTLHELVNSYFTLENFGIIPAKKPILSLENQKAIDILQKTFKRVEGGIEVGLPWKDEDKPRPQSFGVVLKRLEYVKKAMSKDPELKQAYIQAYTELEEKGFIRRLSRKEAQIKTEKTSFIPAFLTFNPNKLPKKFRLVYDAATKVNGQSLNDMLLAGPDNIASLLNILLKFREGPVAVSGDIEAMFPQIRIMKKDQDSLRLLWFDPKTNENIQYVLVRLPFGLNTSPFISQYVKNRNAEEFKEDFPDAFIAITQLHYVDDYIASFKTEEEGARICKDVIDIHTKGGFNIRNFVSNSPGLLKRLDSKKVAELLEINLGEKTELSKVLGIFWEVKGDNITFRLNKNKLTDNLFLGKIIPTKRQVLSVAMSIFDPLCLISYLSIHSKILIQDLWRQGTGWDEPIEKKHYKKWLHWLAQLDTLKGIKIPRQYSPLSAEAEKVELHVFSDASTEAYSAVAYLRFEHGNEIDAALVLGKAKVAPNKPLSIPRLELLGATLAVRVANLVKEKFQLINIQKTHFWTDSRTVLGWIQSPARNYKVFVALRIGEIHENSLESDWNWVSSAANPADLATKYGKIDNWFKPPFLLKSKDQWPIKKLKIDPPDEEIRNLLHLEIQDFSTIDPLRFSKWEKLRFHVAVLQRFIQWIKQKRMPTPNDFLLLGTPSEVPYDEETELTRKQWRISQGMAQQFWKKWTRECLPTLIKRTKWTQPIEGLQVGDVVLVADDNLPRNSWPKGIVLSVNTAADGQVRSCEVKTEKGKYLRHVARLAKLDVRKPDTEDSSGVHNTSDEIQLNFLHTEIIPDKDNNKSTNIFSHSRMENNQEAQDCRRRRQTRTTNRFGWMGYAVSILALIVVCCGKQIEPLSQAGIMIAHDRTIYAQTSIVHWEINTNMNITTDKQAVETKLSLLQGLCQQVLNKDKETSEYCSNQWMVLQRHQEQLFTGWFSTHQRKRRSSGVLHKMWDLLWGTSDTEDELDELRVKQVRMDLQLKKLLNTTLKTFDEGEKLSNEKFKILHATVNRALIHVSKEDQVLDKLVTRDWIDKITIIIETFLNELQSKYQLTERNLGILKDNELKEGLHQVRTQLGEDEMLLPLNTTFVRQILKQQIRLKANILVVHILVPVVYKQPFDQVQLVSIPENTTKKMLNLKHTKVCVNLDSKTYFYPTSPQIQISDEISVTRTNRFLTGYENPNCEIATLFRMEALQRDLCNEIIEVPDGSVQIIKLPKVNQYIYYTDVPLAIEIYCQPGNVHYASPLPNKDKGERLSIGHINLGRTCKLYSKGEFIIAENAESISLRKSAVYFHPYNVGSISTILKKNDLLQLKQQNETDLIQRIQELKDQVQLLPDENYHHKRTTLGISISAMLLTATVAAFVIWRMVREILKRKTSKAGHQNQEVYEIIPISPLEAARLRMEQQQVIIET